MSTTTHLGYENQKILMQYLNTKSRITLQIRCPALNTINKITPLRIQNYHQTVEKLTIDDTSYKFDNQKHFCKIPGNSETMQSLKQQLAIAEANLEVAKTNLNGKDQIDKLNDQIISIKKSIGCWTTGTCIHMVISSANREDRIERITYQSDVGSVKTLFLKNRFSGFQDVRIKNFFVQNGVKKDLCVPFDLKSLKIERLTAWGPRVLDLVYPCLAEPKVKFVELFEEGNYTHDLVKNAGNLTVIGEYEILENMRILFDLPNQQLTLKHTIFTSSAAQRLIRAWQENNHSVGRKYSIEVRDEIRAKVILDYIGRFPNANRAKLNEISETMLPECINLPMSHFTELNVYTVSQQTKNRVTEVFVNFEIHAKGTAKLL